MPRALDDLVDRRAAPEQFVQREQSFGRRHDAAVPQRVEVEVDELRVDVPGRNPLGPVRGIESAFCSDSAKLRPIAITSPTDCIRVPSSARRAGQLLEGPARDLGDDVVDDRLETRRGHLRDVVSDLVERVADRESRRDLGNGKTGRLGRERARATDARDSSR